MTGWWLPRPALVPAASGGQSGAMTILVTGAGGNVGTHVVAELVRRGYDVRALDVRRVHPAGAVAVRADVTDPVALSRAMAGVETVIHLAAVIPPRTDKRPVRARAVNVGGTRNVVAACLAKTRPPRLLFTSTFDVHGRTLGHPPPRHVTDPVVATDAYTEHKIECEELVRGSGLTWAIFRLADVPVLGPRAPRRIMFEIGLDNRIEVLHAGDAAFAIANALAEPRVWGRVLFLGGGASCQVTYREYLTRLMGAMGLEPLPDNAFSTAEYVTDWLDTAEGAELLHYQRHGFADIVTAIVAAMGWRRPAARLAGPWARAAILHLSPYYRRVG